ncbi:MAG TPA: nitrile hydratase subunit beta [bacterium]|nr:nitrile hydratase subunit beta [bacterium]
MNGVHDMGGMHGMGPVPYERDEPVFHAPWEARAFALNIGMRAWRRWNIDAGRYEIELIPPAEYLRMTYYERWFVRLVELLVKRDLVTREEIDTGTPAPGARREKPALTAERVASMVRNGAIASRDVPVAPRFAVNQRVRARTINPAGHTRLPRYVRGRTGTIERDHGVYVFPDTNALFLGEKPQHVYSVRFTTRELWGEQAPPRDAVYLDLWDDYLEPA